MLIKPCPDQNFDTSVMLLRLGCNLSITDSNSFRLTYIALGV